MSDKSIARNAGWNMIGQVAPILVAIAAVPLLIQELGIARFGFLGLAWALIGYASVFDFGIGRALTRVMAAHLGSDEAERALVVGRVGTALMLCIGLVIAAALWFAAPVLVDRVLKIQQDLQGEARMAMGLLALSMPLVLVTSAWRGALEAGQEFARLNVIRMGMGVLTYIAPLAVAAIWPRLEAVVLSVVAMRVIGAWLHAHACRLSFGPMLRFERPDRAVLASLFNLGGWIAVSNIVSPLLSYLDRFVIAQRLTIEQVAYYATPYDLITRTLMLPYSLMAVIFPVLAGKVDREDELRSMYSTSIRMLFVLMWPVIFTAIVLAQPLLTLWLGGDFARAGAPVLQLLAAGVFLSTLAQAPANLIQASGAPRSMALLHLVELPLFITLLWHLVGSHGVQGAALAWALRAGVDGIALYMLASRRLPAGGMPLLWWLKCGGVTALALIGGLWVDRPLQQLAGWLVGMLVFLASAWWMMLNGNDRLWLRARVVSRLRPSASAAASTSGK